MTLLNGGLPLLGGWTDYLLSETQPPKLKQ